MYEYFEATTTLPSIRPFIRTRILVLRTPVLLPCLAGACFACARLPLLLVFAPPLLCVWERKSLSFNMQQQQRYSSGARSGRESMQLPSANGACPLVSCLNVSPAPCKLHLVFRVALSLSYSILVRSLVQLATACAVCLSVTGSLAQSPSARAR